MTVAIDLLSTDEGKDRSKLEAKDIMRTVRLTVTASTLITQAAKPTQGKEESHAIRPVARSKVASVPVGVDAVFLIDESDRIVDVTFGSKEAVHRAAELWQKKTPLKGNFDRISGVIVAPLQNNKIGIRNEAGEHAYEVRPLAQGRLKNLSKGDAIVLLVDDENKVTDVAIPPKSSETNQR
jgi:hypothetical protein